MATSGVPSTYGGSTATAHEAVATLSALTLPHLAPFPANAKWYRDLPDIDPSQELSTRSKSIGPTADVSAAIAGSKVEVARTTMDQCVLALDEITRIEASVAACKAAIIESLCSASAAESAAMGLSVQQREVAAMVARSEMATTLRISEGAATGLIDHSITLIRDRRRSWTALDCGTITWGHANIIAEETEILWASRVAPEGIARYETALLAKAVTCTGASFRGKARRLRERSFPESIAAKTKSAYANRRMYLDRVNDGMTWLNIYLPAPAAEGIWDRTTKLATALKVPEEQRTLAQLRTDMAAALLLGQDALRVVARKDINSPQRNGTHSGDFPSGDFPSDDSNAATYAGSEAASSPRGQGNEPYPTWHMDEQNGGLNGHPGGHLDGDLPPMPTVLPIITIPMLSLLGFSNQPAELEGYGPISIDVARKLTANAPSFYRVLTDPLTGEPLALNPESRRVSRSMRAFLRSQQDECAFPQCTAKAATSDYDHIVAWEHGGNTSQEQLEPLCRKHHKIKHFKDDHPDNRTPSARRSPERASMKLRGWTPTMTASGQPSWTSPSGKYHAPKSPNYHAPSYPRWLQRRIDSQLQVGAESQAQARPRSDASDFNCQIFSPAERVVSYRVRHGT